MQNNSTQTNIPDATAQHTQSAPFVKGWAIPVICTLITAAGAAYTAYSNHKTQSDIETLKVNSERDVIKIKTDTEWEIKQAELRSQENIIRLKNQLEAEKELRVKIAANESAVLSVRATKCAEIKTIRDGMSVDMTHLRYNDPLNEAALLNLQAADYKRTSYLTDSGNLALRSALSEKTSSDALQRFRVYYGAVLEGYNAELRTGCSK
ncbi:hypothetical protein [Pseudomonas grimontii]|uniref:hypothetical protein n=1 Tax=Pseudomonas grimontii TaxID=129847 RepID=UPI00216A7EF2|nr:hypothetical protein [Pseudomonas grimontii]MCS3511249.1 hypothetical protein [Pseudomonas grimontii]